jgi:phosphatidylinositol-3-phosphatase
MDDRRALNPTRMLPLLGAILGCLLALTGPAVAETRAQTAAGSGPCGTSAAAPRTLGHVIWIVFENKSYSSIIGSANAPYINSLAQQCGLATNYFAVARPSLPNYIAMTSGSTQGITDDAGPASHPLSVSSIFSQLGSGWKSLQESMPSDCFKSNSDPYVVRHNPAAYYTNIDCAAGDVPLASPPDLSAAFTLVSPNLCNDMHDCPVQTGDSWLSTFMPTVLASADYQAGNTIVFITWDEGGSSSQQVATLVVSPYTAAGTQALGYYDHYSLLRTTEELLALDALGNASTAPSMASAFGLKARFYPRPRGATPLRVSLVPAYQQCTQGTAAHGTPLSYPSCNPPEQTSGQLTIGTPDSNDEPSKSLASVTLHALPGDPATSADEADVWIRTSITDVRRKSDLSDYTGEVQPLLSVRLTDHATTTSGDEPQTVEDFPLRVTVPCTPTTSTGTGSTCSLVTTADTVVPGAVLESKRSLWALDQVQVYDGGSDGAASTTDDNTLFMDQGLFVP